MPETHADNLLYPGQLIAGCRVTGFLGAGAMGQVYQCEHLRLEKPVALKILPTIDQGSIKRFLREAQLAAKIEHPNVLTIFDVGQDPATKLYYILMQYIAGKNLAELVKQQRGPLGLRLALQLVRGAAQGAAAVHAKGLIHRDIKPANIMYAEADRRVKLMDFGLVREVAPTDPTGSLGPVGTPVYMSPEQCRGAADLDARSDLVALGGTLYFLLTGRLPYTSTTPTKHIVVDVMDQIVSGRTPPPVHALNPTVPPSVSQLVARAMAPARADRFADARAMVAAIDRVLRTAGPSAPTVSRTRVEQSDVASQTAVIHDLELVIEDTPSLVERIPKPWLAAAGGVAGLLALMCVFVALFGLAWFLNHSGKNGGGKKVPGKDDPPTVISALPDKTKMVRIPAGTVVLGNSQASLRLQAASLDLSPGDAANFALWGTEQPTNRVNLPAFWIDKYEVTNGEYAVFVRKTGRAPPQHWGGNVPPAHMEDHPVVFVRHADAVAYAEWAKKKLPNHAQWLRAFRDDKEWYYPWGNTWAKPYKANVAENLNHPNLSAVTATPEDVTRFGVCNMVGNAEEMLRDLEPYQGATSVIIRGASWGRRGAVFGHAAFPSRIIPVGQEATQSAGFRCVSEEP
jgi:serine/threonine-protein kinase